MEKLRIFRFSKQELLLSLPTLAMLLVAQAFMLCYHFERFTRGGNLGFWSIFAPKFTISGFDPYIYLTLSRWDVYYAVSRHPLLAYFWYPFAQLNHWLMAQTEVNYAIFIVAAVHTVLAFYAFLYLFRILKDVVRVAMIDAWLLAFGFFSLGYILLTAIVPDHFCLSLYLLLLTLYVSGSKLRGGHFMSVAQTTLLYLLTAGTTLSNGVYTFLAQLFCARRQTLRWRRLLLSFVIPTLVLFGLSYYQQEHIVKPRIERQQRALEKKKKKEKKVVALQKQTKKLPEAHPLDVFNLTMWLDTSTSRTASFVENFIGESVWLHTDHLLEDQVKGRPVIVGYQKGWEYVVIGLILLLAIAGFYCGRHDRFMWLCGSWLAFTLLLHFVLGFALKEVYIMAAHWLFLLPVMTAFLFRYLHERHTQSVRVRRALTGLRLLVFVLMILLYGHNLNLIADYLLAH